MTSCNKLRIYNVILSVLCVLSPIRLCNPMDCSPPGSSVHGIFQSRILAWIAISSSRGSSQPRDQTRLSCISSIGRQILYQLGYQSRWKTRMSLRKVEVEEENLWRFLNYDQGCLCFIFNWLSNKWKRKFYTENIFIGISINPKLVSFTRNF